MVDRVTAAAFELLAEHGINGLTIDAVARQAGVSKGAVTHHFRTKVQLASHLLRESVDAFERSIDELRADDETPGAWTRAYIKATFESDKSEDLASVPILLVPVMRAPELQQILHDFSERVLRCIARDGLNAIAANLVRLAVDGWWWNETAGLSTFANDDHRRDFFNGLLRVASAQDADILPSLG